MKKNDVEPIIYTNVGDFVKWQILDLISLKSTEKIELFALKRINLFNELILTAVYNSAI